MPLIIGEPAVRGPGPAAPLSPLETEIIDLFVQVSRLLGQPRSLAEIYGLLFISALDSGRISSNTEPWPRVLCTRTEP